jgi:hypothetical protein
MMDMFDGSRHHDARFSAFNDSWHVANRPNSMHTKGGWHSIWYWTVKVPAPKAWLPTARNGRKRSTALPILWIGNGFRARQGLPGGL